jgi:hypothetical protein
MLRRDFIRDIDEIPKLGAELEEYLGLPVDLIPLNETPPKFKVKILIKCLPIIIRNRSLYT